MIFLDLLIALGIIVVFGVAAAVGYEAGRAHARDEKEKP